MNDSDLSKSFILPIAFVICALGVVLTAFTGWNYYQNQNRKEELGYSRARQQADQVTEAIKTEMQAEMALAQNVADKLSSGDLPYDQVVDYLYDIFRRQKELRGLRLALLPMHTSPMLSCMLRTS